MRLEPFLSRVSDAMIIRLPWLSLPDSSVVAEPFYLNALVDRAFDPVGLLAFVLAHQIY